MLLASVCLPSTKYGVGWGDWRPLKHVGTSFSNLSCRSDSSMEYKRCLASMVQDTPRSLWREAAEGLKPLVLSSWDAPGGTTTYRRRRAGSPGDFAVQALDEGWGDMISNPHTITKLTDFVHHYFQPSLPHWAIEGRKERGVPCVHSVYVTEDMGPQK